MGSFLLHGGTSLSAYIDAGTGSMAIQALIAGLLSVGFVIKTQWNNLKMMIGLKMLIGSRKAKQAGQSDPQ